MATMSSRVTPRKDWNWKAHSRHHCGTLISYPISTSVELPSQPLVPAVESMKRDVGSIYSDEITPARGGPGMMRNGTAECLKLVVSRRSYSRRMSWEALRGLGVS